MFMSVWGEVQTCCMNCVIKLKYRFKKGTSAPWSSFICLDTADETNSWQQRSDLLQTSRKVILLQSHVKLDFVLTHQGCSCKNPTQSWEPHHEACREVDFSVCHAVFGQCPFRQGHLRPKRVILASHSDIERLFWPIRTEDLLENGSQCRQIHLGSLQGLIHGFGCTQCSSLLIRENNKLDHSPLQQQLLCTSYRRKKCHSCEVLCFHDWLVTGRTGLSGLTGRVTKYEQWEVLTGEMKGKQ